MRPVHSLLAAAVLVLGTAPTLAETVGVTAAVNPAARGTPPRQAVRTLVLGENVFHDERIETDTGGLLQILLADGTAFTVGPNSALTIDRFVYDPRAGTAEVSASLTRGVFRFIGGRTSKTPGGVALNTPVGTIGIRGAVVDVNLAGRGGTGEIEAHIDMIFGDEVVLDGPGGLDRIYEPGYSIVIRQAAEGGRNQEVTKTPAAFRSEIQQALSGAAGTTGGSKNPPTEAVVAESRVAEENSDRTPAMNNLPIPERRPENIGDRDETVIADAGSDLVRDTVEEIADRPPPVEPEEPVEPPPPPPAEPTIVPLRVVTAGETYTTYFGDVVSNPGSVGLIGGSPQTDQKSDLVFTAPSLQGKAVILQGDLLLPLYNDASPTTHSILGSSGASLGGVPLTGTALSDADGFTAYSLAINGDLTQPLYAFRGTATADIGVLQDGDVRRYSFTRDLLQNLPVPFMLGSAGGGEYAGAAITDFYIAESSSPLQVDPRMFQAWLYIAGQGPSQTSAVGVNAATLSNDDNVYHFDFGRRGSYRTTATASPMFFSETIDSLTDGRGGNALFGSNAQNMILTNPFEDNDALGDSAADRSSHTEFATLHVLALQSEAPLANFLAQTDAGRSLGSQSGNAINGFAAGLDEGVRADDSEFLFASTSGADANNLHVEFDATSNSLGGELAIGTNFTVDHFAFGNGVRGNSDYGASAYISDDMFAATQNDNPNRTYLQDLDGAGNIVQEFPLVEGERPRTYFVSGDAIPQPDLLPQGRLCDCDFLEWGWWGSQVRTSTPPGSATEETVRTNIHLGTWAAGKIAGIEDVATLAGTTATYEGHAVGTVSSTGYAGSSNYIAAGDMRMNWDFGQRTGDMTLENFDSRNFSGTLSGADIEGNASFGGPLSQTNSALDASGSVNGAFVNDGPTVAAGVVGNFALRSQSGDWGAVGIIGGARAPQQ